MRITAYNMGVKVHNPKIILELYYPTLSPKNPSSFFKLCICITDDRYRVTYCCIINLIK